MGDGVGTRARKGAGSCMGINPSDGKGDLYDSGVRRQKQRKHKLSEIDCAFGMGGALGCGFRFFAVDVD